MTETTALSDLTSDDLAGALAVAGAAVAIPALSWGDVHDFCDANMLAEAVIVEMTGSDSDTVHAWIMADTTIINAATDGASVLLAEREIAQCEECHSMIQTDLAGDLGDGSHFLYCERCMARHDAEYATTTINEEN